MAGECLIEIFGASYGGKPVADKVGSFYRRAPKIVDALILFSLICQDFLYGTITLRNGRVGIGARAGIRIRD